MKRRDVLPAAAALALLPKAFGGKLPDGVLDEKSAKLIKEPFGDLRIFYEGPTDQLKSMTAGSLRLNAGASPHPPHKHPEEEFMIVTEGTGEISVAGKVTKVAPGSIMYCAGNKLHGVVNTGKTPLLFYFLKWQA
ncbi:MAG TPA: cupin domain-containing protein [Bryobacteraceae bacterium]|nr:cupin domain-containing protein [Bryobacteraceae bacterium]